MLYLLIPTFWAKLSSKGDNTQIPPLGAGKYLVGPDGYIWKYYCQLLSFAHARYHCWLYILGDNRKWGCWLDNSNLEDNGISHSKSEYRIKRCNTYRSRSSKDGGEHKNWRLERRIYLQLDYRVLNVNIVRIWHQKNKLFSVTFDATIYITWVYIPLTNL